METSLENIATNQHLVSSPRPTRTTMVSMQVIRTLVELVASAGVPRASFLRDAQLEPHELQAHDARVPRAKLYDLFELALDLTADPAFALHSVERLTSETLSPIEAMVAHATTLQEALSALHEFRGVLGDEATFRVHEEGGQVTVRSSRLTDPRLRVRRYMAEVMVAGLFRVIQRFRADAHIEYVAFEYAAPEHAHEYTRIFGERVRFDQKFTGLVFDRALVDTTASNQDAELHAALRVFARRRVTHRNDGMSYAVRVHEILVCQRPSRDKTMDAVARSLGVSVRSLRRYLTAEGKTYASLLSEAQACIAKTCLLDERRTIMETAIELGFADKPGFHRAFKRWTGITPGEFRRRQGVAAVDETDTDHEPEASAATSVAEAPSFEEQH
ncbi:MAG: AraC family transcriptional regulator [Polyangiales bacterium]